MSDKKTENFFSKLLNLFLPGNDPDRERKRLLRELAQEMKRQKYKFYRVRGDQALPGLAKFFHEVYKLVGPGALILQNADTSNVLREIIIEHFMTEEQRDLADLLSEDSIREEADRLDPKELTETLKSRLVSFFAGFSAEKVREINGTYNLLQVFLGLLRIDYYFLLKKFDSGLRENDFNYNPKFEAINGDYVGEDLKDFLEVLPLMERNAPWTQLFEILQQYKAAPIVLEDAWKKTGKLMFDVKRSNILLMIVQLIDKDPYYQPKLQRPNERIVEDYLNRVKTQTELVIQKIAQEKRNQKIEKLATLVFGTSAISRMKYYTEKANLMFSKKMMGGFIHVQAANYLKAFMLDYYKKDIRELVDHLLIRGKWSTPIMSQQLSEAFHATMDFSESLLGFDENLSDESTLGTQFKNAVSRADRDPNSMKWLRQTLKETNDKALKIIQGSAMNLITVGKNLKLVIEDQGRAHHEVITNWRELSGTIDGDLGTRLKDTYTKIYYFIQLLQFYVGKSTKR